MSSSRLANVSSLSHKLAIRLHLRDNTLKGLKNRRINLCIDALRVNHVIIKIDLQPLLLLVVERESSVAPLFEDLLLDNDSEALLETVELDLEFGIIGELLLDSPALTILQVHLPVLLFDSPDADVVDGADHFKLVDC